MSALQAAEPDQLRLVLALRGGQVLTLSEPPSQERRLNRIYGALMGVIFALLLAGFLLGFSGGDFSLVGWFLVTLVGPGAWLVVPRIVARLEGT